MTETIKVTRFDAHPLWGACVFLEAQSEEPEAVRSAYAAGAADWPPLHFAVSGPSAEALDPWYRLGFAQMHAYGATASRTETFDVPGVELRRGGIDDLATAAAIDLLIHRAQADPPSYSNAPYHEAEHRASWRETLEGDDVTYVVAERGRRPIGHATLYPDPADDDALHLASTAVVPEERGHGIGRLLTAFAFTHTTERGFARLRTNWRVTNLAASRYWPARGFELTHIRLVRRLPDL
jgi:ribosomal protein S18 acetylase RimI-like enzyme